MALAVTAVRVGLVAPGRAAFPDATLGFVAAFVDFAVFVVWREPDFPRVFVAGFTRAGCHAPEPPGPSR